MRSHHDLNMPILRGRDHLDRRLAALLGHHDTFVLVDVFSPGRPEEENIVALRRAASAAPRHLQTVMPCGPSHAMLLLAATPKFARATIDYATRLAGEDNYVVSQDGQVRDRQGHPVPALPLGPDAIDTWAAHLGVDLRADGLFDRTPSFVRYAAAIRLS